MTNEVHLIDTIKKFEDVSVGDTVHVYSPTKPWLYTVSVVERMTKTMMFVKGQKERFWRHDGSQVGHSYKHAWGVIWVRVIK